MRRTKERLILQRALDKIRTMLTEKGISGRELGRRTGMDEAKFAMIVKNLPLKIDVEPAHAIFREVVENGGSREGLLKVMGEAITAPGWLLGLALVDLDQAEITPEVYQEIVRLIWARYRNSGP